MFTRQLPCQGPMGIARKDLANIRIDLRVFVLRRTNVDR
jgi:hypothetical protein